MLEAYLCGMPPMRRARALACLQTRIRVNGAAVMSRAELIEARLAGGGTIGMREGKRALIRPDGAYMLESAVTRTGMDYADFLIRSATQ